MDFYFNENEGFKREISLSNIPSFALCVVPPVFLKRIFFCFLPSYLLLRTHSCFLSDDYSPFLDGFLYM